MSSHNDKTAEYRKNKKQNKAKIRSGQMSKVFSHDYDNILNQLPSGDFDKKTEVIENETKTEPKKEEIKITVSNIPNVKDDILYNDDMDDYEEFDADYFEPKVYK